MADLHFVLPGSRTRRTGGFIYDDRIIRGLEGLGYGIETHELPDDFPRPSPATVRSAAAVLGGIPAAAKVIVDGLALGVLPGLVGEHCHRLSLIALVHHPLALETGLDRQQKKDLFASERDALSTVTRVVTTSRTTADCLQAYDVDSEAIRVVRPGADPAPLAQRNLDGPLRFFCAATLTGRKGHDVLLRALAQIKDRPWSLTCAGSADEDPQAAAEIFALCRDLGLQDRVSFLGTVDAEQMGSLYNGADAFVLASHYEGYGMVLSEAQTYGLPVVSTTGGAIPEAVGDAAALLVPPGDHKSLARALARLLDEPALRGELAKAAEVARRDIPTWDQAAQAFAGAVDLAPRK